MTKKYALSVEDDFTEKEINETINNNGMKYLPWTPWITGTDMFVQEINKIKNVNKIVSITNSIDTKANPVLLYVNSTTILIININK